MGKLKQQLIKNQEIQQSIFDMSEQLTQTKISAIAHVDSIQEQLEEHSLIVFSKKYDEVSYCKVTNEITFNNPADQLVHTEYFIDEQGRDQDYSIPVGAFAHYQAYTDEDGNVSFEKQYINSDGEVLEVETVKAADLGISQEEYQYFEMWLKSVQLWRNILTK